MLTAQPHQPGVRLPQVFADWSTEAQRGHLTCLCPQELTGSLISLQAQGLSSLLFRTQLGGRDWMGKERSKAKQPGVLFVGGLTWPGRISDKGNTQEIWAPRGPRPTSTGARLGPGRARRHPSPTACGAGSHIPLAPAPPPDQADLPEGYLPACSRATMVACSIKSRSTKLRKSSLYTLRSGSWNV